MNIIERIEISYFRSFKKVEIFDLKDLNMFSGANDSGKSNILRALNLFFNNEISPGVGLDIERDFNFIRNEEIQSQTKGKKSIDITVHFLAKGYTKFRDIRFSVKKRWNFEGVHSTTVFKDKNWNAEIYNIYREPNIYTKASITDPSQRLKSINRFLNEIFFFYVPAIKDEKYFSHIFGKLLSTIKDNEKLLSTQEISQNIEGLESSINNKTKSILDQFTGIGMQFNVPKQLETFFSAFDIGTVDLNHEINKRITIKSRGDGIQAKLIPLLLELLEINQNNKTKNKNTFIWGFEEPENSFEYKNANELALKFKNIYSLDKNRQIFLTTHSFNFLSLEGEQIATYRIFRGNTYVSEILGPIGSKRVEKQTSLLKDENLLKLDEELGFFTLNKELEKLFLEKEEERKNFIELSNAIKKNKKDNFLLVEGELEKVIFDKIFGGEQNLEIVRPGSGANNLANYLISKSFIKDNKKYLGLFDKDSEGKNACNKYEDNKGNLHSNIQKTFIIPNENLKLILSKLKIEFSLDELFPDFVWKYLDENDFLEDAEKFNIKIIDRNQSYNEFIAEKLGDNKIFELKVTKKVQQYKKNDLKKYILSLEDEKFNEIKDSLIPTINKIKEYFNFHDK